MESCLRFELGLSGRGCQGRQRPHSLGLGLGFRVRVTWNTPAAKSDFLWSRTAVTAPASKCSWPRTGIWGGGRRGQAMDEGEERRREKRRVRGGPCESHYSLQSAHGSAWRQVGCPHFRLALSWINSTPHAHTHTYIATHTHTHTHAHARTHTRTHTRACAP